jgi:hypothetical protein
MNKGDRIGGIGEYDSGEGKPMASDEGGRKAFIISGEATEARYPAKGTFEDPAMREKNEAVSGLGQVCPLREGFRGLLPKLRTLLRFFDIFSG